MSYSVVFVTTITLIAAFMLSGCDSPSNKMDKAEVSVIEAERDLKIAKSEVEAELQMYREENAKRITEYNRTISEIEQKIENESDKEVKDRFEIKLDEVEESHHELKREIDNYEASGRENWDDFKDNFTNRMDDLGTSLKDFFSSSDTNSSTN